MNKLNFNTLYFDDSDTGDNAADKGTNAATGDNKGGNDSTKAADQNKTEPAGNTEDEKKYTDKDIDRIVEKKLAKWQKQKAAEIDEAAKLANMNAQEKAEHERDKLRAELEELKKANVRSEMEKTARNILQTGGVNIPDEIVSRLVGDDAEETSANVKAFTKSFKAAVQAEVKSQLSHKTPITGTSGSGITKEAIAKETNPLKRQAMIKANLDLYGGVK